MKKQLGVLMAAAMVVGSLAGCSSKPAETKAATEAATTAAAETKAAETKAATTETTAAGAAAGGLKTGMAVITSLKSSKDAGDKDGKAQADSTVVALVLDADGKIVSCSIDDAQSKMGFTKEGKVVMTDAFKTKRESKEEYGMKAASGIGKEWYEQADAMEQYVIGKTAEEVAGIAMDADTKPTDADLTAGVTIKMGDYIAAITEAANNAKEIGTQPGDKLGLGIVTNMEKSKDAASDKDGQCQAYSTYTAVTMGADGKITAALIDSTQGTVKFDTTGKITTDLTVGVKTKKQLGADYGMKAASGIGKEWDEQAAAMETYLVGKTIEEVSGIAIDEDTKPKDADLAASVTISIGDFQATVAKAAANAK
ncbi:MAG: hypothetical protein RR590_10125 [Hungatella sp.]